MDDRSMRMRALLPLLLGVALAWTVPLVVLTLAGQAIALYLRLPPRTEQVTHAPFSWAVFGGYALLLALAAAMLWMGTAGRKSAGSPHAPMSTFPWWGTLRLVVMACGWVFAWSDTLAPVEVRRHAFAVLWLGYILALNGLVQRPEWCMPA